MPKRSRGFPPVVDENVTTLILGSFPSAASLQKGQYYGHPHNQFWKLVGRVIEVPLHEMHYEGKLRTLLARHVGLWDIIDRCERAGSLDSNIRNPRHNEFEHVKRIARRLRRICFNGKTAAKLESLFAAWGYETVVLPSSSPANTLAFEVKLDAWRQIMPPDRSARGTRSAPDYCGHAGR
ncbi:MAG: DNA-deoxyinosine glycosylase [Betaproteobacteria bacterium RIFCSPLOWO2_12_FULL_62_58]|nr:MAG: DNA-deoxyinosine glycosylase [Betaproteobacteria bacterium RIFCSPLOWO2_12_FULL_62_58]